MKSTKIVFIWVAMLVFFGFSIIGALGAFGVIEISNWGTAAAIIGPCIGICGSVIGAKHMFNDPEAMTELKAKHAEETANLKAGHAKAVNDLKTSLKGENSKLTKAIDEFDSEKQQEIAKIEAAAEKECLKRLGVKDDEIANLEKAIADRDRSIKELGEELAKAYQGKPKI